MATNNYIQIQIISRNKDFYTNGGSRTKMTYAGHKSKTGINAASNANYSSLPNAGTDETWYCSSYGSPSSYSSDGYAPFGMKNTQMVIEGETGLRFVIDLVHTETNSSANSWSTYPIVRTNDVGTYTYAPFNDVVNGWVSVDENNFLNVYIDSVNNTYFPNLNSEYYSQLLVQVFGHWETASSTYNITNTATNCTASNAQTTIEQGENYTNTFTPNDGYVFTDNSKPSAVCAGTTYQAVINQDGTATITIENVSGDIRIEGTAAKKHTLSLELYNCVLYDGETQYGFDYVIEGETYHFVLHSNDGFIFKDFPTWKMGTTQGEFSLSTNDKTIARISWNLYDYIIIDNNLSIQANATISEGLKYGFVSIYNPTFDELDKLSKKRFFEIPAGEYSDLSSYIISLRKVYVDIPQVARELVYFGSNNTGISCNIITANFIETDCGTVTIEEYNKNSLDYNGVEIDLYLPFIGNISLNPNQVYGKPLRLVYRTNPLNGDCVAVIYSDNMQIAYSQGNVSFDVPINFQYGNLNNYGTNDNALYMAELQPYIEARTNRQYQNMNNDLLNNNLWVQISDCSGGVMFGDVDLRPVSCLNKDEYDEIVSLLKGGIIV